MRLDPRYANAPLVIGAILLSTQILAALLVPYISPWGITAPDGMTSLTPPDARHWLGTDLSGFDVLTRLLYAARIDLSIAVVGVGTALILGVPLGLVAGYSRGWVGGLIVRVTDVVQAVPAMALAVTLVALAGNSPAYVVGALALLNLPSFLRLVRGEVLRVRELRFIDAAIALGNSPIRVLFVHILPNAVQPVFVQLGLSLSYATLTVGAMSFLGIGIQAPTPEWGSMMRAGATDIVTGQWWTVVFPGLALANAVAGFNLLAEGLERARVLNSRSTGPVHSKDAAATAPVLEAAL